MPAPSEEVYSDVLAGAAQPASTTMAFGRLLRNLVRDPQVGRRVVPIIPDEARTFGMDPLFKELGIYNPLGQQYEAVDRQLLLSYREATDGQILEEGITEAGSMASFTAAGTSTRSTVSRSSRSTSSTRCSASSGPATRHGPSVTRADAVS